MQLEQQQKRAEEQGEHPHVLTTHAPVAASPASIDRSRTTAWAVFLLAFSSVFREVPPIMPTPNPITQNRPGTACLPS